MVRIARMPYFSIFFKTIVRSIISNAFDRSHITANVSSGSDLDDDDAQ